MQGCRVAPTTTEPLNCVANFFTKVPRGGVRQRCSAAKLTWRTASIVLGAMVVAQPAFAQTFGQASSAALNAICAGAFPSFTKVTTTSQIPRNFALDPITPDDAKNFLGYTTFDGSQGGPIKAGTLEEANNSVTLQAAPTIKLGANLSRVCQARLPRPMMTQPASPFDGLHACFGQDSSTGNCSDVGGPITSTTSTTTQGSPGAVSSSGGSSLPLARAAAVQERLQQVRNQEEEKLEGRLPSPTYAQNEPANRLGDTEVIPVPPSTPGGFPGAVFVLSPGLSAYLSAGGTAVNHRNNPYEDGYHAVVPEVAVGVDYLITSWMLAGLAFNYSNIDGNYDEGGNFDTNNYGPMIYVTFLPFKGAFINTVFGYTWQDNSNQRLSDPSLGAAGPISADYNTNVYSASILSGYDYPIDNFTVGPRLGASVAHWQTDNFTERGSTGLEMKYSGLNQTSVQSSFGLQASVVIETSFGYLVPQMAAAWVHEYANDARNTQAQFVEASPSPVFTFQREKPARNWADIGIGATAVLPNGLQPFVQFATMQGNDNFVTYGGSAGVRASF